MPIAEAMISLIPPEVLVVIFRAALDPPHCRREVTISHVCRRWREVAIAEPALWTHIRTSFEKPGLTRTIATAYLSRSKDQPLDVSVALLGDTTLDGWNHGAKVMALLIPHAHRWARFSFICWSEGGMMEFRKLLSPLAVPMLKRFEIIFLPFENLSHRSEIITGSPSDLVRPSIFTGGAGSLRVARIDNCHLTFLQPPTSNITTLSLNQLEGEIHFSYVQFTCIITLPALENLSWVIGDVATPLRGASSTVVTNLKSFRWFEEENSPRVAFWTLMTNVQAPRLESLTLRNVQMPEERVIHPSTFPVLQTLNILSPSTRAEHLHLPKLSHVFPTVSRLVIISLGQVVETFSRAMLDSGAKTWPKLNTLEIHTVYDAELPSLIEFLEMRQATGRPLDTFWSHNNISTATYDALRPLVKVDRRYRFGPWPPGTAGLLDETDDPFYEDLNTVLYEGYDSSGSASTDDQDYSGFDTDSEDYSD